MLNKESKISKNFPVLFIIEYFYHFTLIILDVEENGPSSFKYETVEFKDTGSIEGINSQFTIPRTRYTAEQQREMKAYLEMKLKEIPPTTEKKKYSFPFSP